VTRPIVVIGCPRSGTTLVQLMLHAHPRIAVPPETRFVLRAYERRRDFDFTTPDGRRAFAHWLVRTKRLRVSDLGLDRATVIERVVAAPPTLGSVLAAVFAAYAERFGKPRWGDKRPGYYAYLPEILRLFPDAQVIDVVRDGRDCVASICESQWYRRDLFVATSMWTHAVDRGRWAAAHLPPTSYYRLRYEDLVLETEKVLRDVCQFLDEDYASAMCEPERMAGVAVPERKDWHALTHEPVTGARISRWTESLGPREQALCETVMRSRLERLGYAVDGKQSASARDVLRYRTVDARRRTAIRRVQLVDRIRSIGEPSLALIDA
jgi:hypothetical protein